MISPVASTTGTVTAAGYTVDKVCVPVFNTLSININPDAGRLLMRRPDGYTYTVPALASTTVIPTKNNGSLVMSFTPLLLDSTQGLFDEALFDGGVMTNSLGSSIGIDLVMIAA